ncbi:hypothetical protein Bbelb_385960 [Branchiostoma belcheri]|nr:hypothetical protein Bbelb_385960 [Branchiostoma belcheri]
MGLTAREKEDVIPGIVDTRIKAIIEDTIANAFQHGGEVGVLAAIVPSIVSAVREAVVDSIQAELAKHYEGAHRQREELEDLKTKYTNLKSEFNTLQTKVNNLGQYSRRNCAIISGIPELKHLAALMRTKTTASGRAALKKNGIFEARSLVKMKLFNQAWSYDGNIFVKTPQDERRVLYTSIDLDAYRVPEPPGQSVEEHNTFIEHLQQSADIIMTSRPTDKTAVFIVGDLNSASDNASVEIERFVADTTFLQLISEPTCITDRSSSTSVGAVSNVFSAAATFYPAWPTKPNPMIFSQDQHSYSSGKDRTKKYQRSVRSCGAVGSAFGSHT